MWLQGGPGGSSTGIGNFHLIGPLDTSLKRRNITWIDEANILFVDNPVGTGYSYVTDSSKYTTDVDQIAKDLVTLMVEFYKKHPTLKTAPFWVFSESYGGKMAAAFGKHLYLAAKAGQIEANFKGVALGDAWNHPMAFVNAWAPYLYGVSQLDEDGFAQVDKAAKLTQKAVDEGRWAEATRLWAQTEHVVQRVTANCDFYNILEPRRAFLAQNMTSAQIYEDRMQFRITSGLDNLPSLMNGPIKRKLNIPAGVSWGGQANKVFEKQEGDFMKPNVDTVDELLELGIEVVVYTGNLDLICCSPGTLEWMRMLKWNGAAQWRAAKRNVLSADGTVQGFTKHYKNLKFYQFLTAGHMVPADLPDAGFLMLKQVIAQH